MTVPHIPDEHAAPAPGRIRFTLDAELGPLLTISLELSPQQIAKTLADVLGAEMAMEVAVEMERRARAAGRGES